MVSQVLRVAALSRGEISATMSRELGSGPLDGKTKGPFESARPMFPELGNGL